MARPLLREALEAANGEDPDGQTSGGSPERRPTKFFAWGETAKWEWEAKHLPPANRICESISKCP